MDHHANHYGTDLFYIAVYYEKRVRPNRIRSKNYVLSDSVINEMKKDNILKRGLESLTGKTYTTQKR